MKKSDLKNNTFECVRVVKGLAVEDIPTLRENLLSQVASFNALGIIASMTEYADSFLFSNGQFYMKPRQPRETVGTIQCCASFMKFDEVRIEYADITMTDVGFETSNAFYNIIRRIV